MFEQISSIFCLLTEKTSEISYVIARCSNTKMLLMESATTDFTENPKGCNFFCKEFSDQTISGF